MTLNLDDYDKIPCSCEEYVNEVDSRGFACAVFSYGNWTHFKLAPKKRFEEGRNFSEKPKVCPTCGPTVFHFKGSNIPDLVTCDDCLAKKRAKPDRFAQVDALIEGTFPEGHYIWQNKFWKEYARAVVELIDKEKA